MLFLLPILAAVARGGALPGWWLPPEIAILAVPLRVLYWEKGGSRWGDYLGGVAHVVIYFRFLSEIFWPLPLFVAVFLGAWWLAERWLYRKLRGWLPLGLAGAAALLTVEWLRGQVPIGGIPWGSLALGMAERPVAREWAAIWGESGWVVLIALSGAFVWSLLGKRDWRELLPAPLMVAFGMVFSAAPPATQGEIEVLGVQANVGVRQKHSKQGLGGQADRPPTSSEVLKKHANLTARGLYSAPSIDLVVWGETMLTHPVSPPKGAPGGDGYLIRPWLTHREERKLDDLRAYQEAVLPLFLNADGRQRRFVTGAHFYGGVELPEQAWEVGQPRQPQTWSPRSSETIVFNAQGVVEDHVSKKHLVPLGEQLPFGGKFPGGDSVALLIFEASRLFPRFADSGRSGPLQVGERRLGAAVCWENVFEGPFRKQAAAGAEAFLLLSNENWYGLSEEMDQMVAATQFRAAETGRPIFRVANTGVTGLFGGGGEQFAQLPRGEAAYLGVRLPWVQAESQTFYMRVGWLILPSIALFSLFAAALHSVLLRRNRSVRSEKPAESSPSLA